MSILFDFPLFSFLFSSSSSFSSWIGLSNSKYKRGCRKFLDLSLKSRLASDDAMDGWQFFGEFVWMASLCLGGISWCWPNSGIPVCEFRCSSACGRPLLTTQPGTPARTHEFEPQANRSPCVPKPSSSPSRLMCCWSSPSRPSFDPRIPVEFFSGLCGLIVCMLFGDGCGLLFRGLAAGTCMAENNAKRYPDVCFIFHRVSFIFDLIYCDCWSSTRLGSVVFLVLLLFGSQLGFEGDM